MRTDAIQRRVRASLHSRQLEVTPPPDLATTMGAAGSTLLQRLGVHSVELNASLAEAVATVHEVAAVARLDVGTIVLTADDATARALVCRLTGSLLPEGAPEVTDGLVELARWIITRAAATRARPGARAPGDGAQRGRGYLQTELGLLCVQVHLREATP